MKVQGTAILLIPEDNKEYLKGNVIIPKTLKDKPNIGTVIEVGDGCTQVKIGNKIRYNRKAANKAHVNGVEYHFINESQCMYIEK